MRPSLKLSKAFTLIELLVVVLILGILSYFVLPAYITSVLYTRQSTANSNARALAAQVQARAVGVNAYNTTLAAYAVDLGGSIPLNPCTGTTTGYTITATTINASVVATTGTNCGTWTPITYNLTL